ncbi:MAG: hypothetical protein C7B46_07850 [Sulfobacillus benefaciens]|uniref:Uncharacterized protein n=1 Tax=Sulfobacillus benefaciens TaxID=453960 RepID=A0A2T2XHA3_9FIRM|nr:MAG: hypothetical protein C7B46_07850 [Sulfobacillus benefaciens]
MAVVALFGSLALSSYEFGVVQLRSGPPSHSSSFSPNVASKLDWVQRYYPPESNGFPDPSGFLWIPASPSRHYHEHANLTPDVRFFRRQ